MRPVVQTGWAGCLGAMAFVALAAAPAEAQTSTLFGNRGPLSQTGGGFAGPSSSAFGASGAGGQGARTGAGGGFGQAGGGFGGRGGFGGATATQGTMQLGQLSTTIGQGFVGRSDNLGRFVGNQAAGQQGGMQTAPTFQRGRTAGATGRGTRGAVGGVPPRPATGRRAGSLPPGVRPQLRIAFSYPERSAPALGTVLNARLDRAVTRVATLRGVRVNVDAEGTVTLRGSVPTEAARGLAAALVRLEPGVRGVRNEVTVGR